MKVIIVARLLIAPLLVLLYVGAIVPLLVRNGAQAVCMLMDLWFDALAALAGWDPDYWPLPRSSEAPLWFDFEL